MIIRSMPQSIQNNIVKVLKPLVEADRLNSLKKYYNFLRENINTPKDTDPLKYHNIADRLNTTRYFYFPTEWNVNEMNCFERSASLYVAFHELYPGSDPSLITLTDEYKNMHAAVLFTHDSRLWGADPSFNYFGEIQLTHDAIIVPPKELDDIDRVMYSYYLSRPEEHRREINNLMGERKISFKKINALNGKSLENLVDTLRSQPGIIDFLYKSGQRVSQSWSGLVDKSLFMKIRPDGSIISEIRVSGDSIGERGACLRFNYNPTTERRDVEFLRYTQSNWGALLSPEREILLVPRDYKLGDYTVDDGPIAQFKDVIFYMNSVKNNFSYEELMNFAKNPIAQHRFKTVLQAAQEIDDSTYIKSLNYLRSRFGPARDLSPAKHVTLTVKNMVNVENSGLSHNNAANLSLNNELEYGVIYLENLLEEFSLVLIPPLIKLFDDSKKYMKEASKYVKQII